MKSALGFFISEEAILLFTFFTLKNYRTHGFITGFDMPSSAGMIRVVTYP